MLRGARGARAATWVSLGLWSAWALVFALWIVAAA
jgi:hypothetical protein